MKLTQKNQLTVALYSELYYYTWSFAIYRKLLATEDIANFSSLSSLFLSVHDSEKMKRPIGYDFLNLFENKGLSSESSVETGYHGNDFHQELKLTFKDFAGYPVEIIRNEIPMAQRALFNKAKQYKLEDYENHLDTLIDICLGDSIDWIYIDEEVKEERVTSHLIVLAALFKANGASDVLMLNKLYSKFSVLILNTLKDTSETKSNALSYSIITSVLVNIKSRNRELKLVENKIQSNASNHLKPQICHSKYEPYVFNEHQSSVVKNETISQPIPIGSNIRFAFNIIRKETEFIIKYDDERTEWYDGRILGVVVRMTTKHLTKTKVLIPKQRKNRIDQFGRLKEMKVKFTLDDLQMESTLEEFNLCFSFV